MSELTTTQIERIKTVSIGWTPDTAQDTLNILEAMGIPVFRCPIDSPAERAKEYKCLMWSWGGQCLCGLVAGHFENSFKDVSEFMVWWYSE